MSEGVYNSLVDMVIAVGMTEATGLNPSHPQPPPLFHHENRLFSTAFDTQILAALSGNVAVFPMETIPQDPNYPPAMVRLRQTAKGNPSIYKTWAVTKTKVKAPVMRKHVRNVTGSLQGSRVRSSSFRVFDFAHKRESSDNLSLKAADLPLSAEALQSLMMFCFPDGAYVKDHEEAASVHYLVLTDISGERSYAVCITMYQAYNVRPAAEGDRWQCTRHEQHKGQGHDLDNGAASNIVYIPLCLVTISKQPYFTVLTDCLSKLVERLMLGDDEWRHLMKEFTLHLTSVPTPPCGPVRLRLELFQDVHVDLQTPDHHGISISDHNLNLPFLHLTIDQVLVVFSAILTQQRMVFVSTHQALFVLVCECFQRLMYPFRWSYTYVPMLSWNLVELVEAPGTFIMGCHGRHRHFIERVEGLVLIDLDIGHIQVCPTLSLPRMPSGPAEVFTMAIQQTRRHVDWLGLSRPTSFSHQTARSRECDHRTQMNKLIQTACLELQSNLFREIFSHANREKRFFHKEQFLQGVDKSDKAFYEKVIEADIFGEFLKDQLSPSRKSDYWSEFLERTKPYNRNAFTPHSDLSLSPSRSGCRKSQSLSTLSTQVGYMSETTPSCTLALPPFVYGLSHVYLDNCLLEIDNKLKGGVTNEIRGSCAYLRGVYLAAQGKRPEAIEAFHEVEACDARLFPIRYVSELLGSLSPEQKDIVCSTFAYHQSALFKEAEENTIRYTSAEAPVIMELSKIPEADIDLYGFTELVHLLFDLTPDTEAVGRLFDALTLGEKTVVDPYTFEEFYKSWKENEVMLQQVQVPADLLDTSEILLKVSDMCKCSCGTGRVALTPKRLFFLHEGSRKYREIIQLRHIKLIELTQQRSLLKPAAALKIHHIDDKVKPFVATLKEVCVEWLLLVGEMWAGKVLAEDSRNPGLIHKAAQNVLLVNAFIQSGQSEFSNHHGYELEEAESLCYYHQRKSSSTNLPPETREFLQHQLDPSGHEAERTAVGALLYTAGKRTGSSLEDYGPRLWCGMGSGKLVIYDAANWSLEAQLALSVEKITCVISVQSRHVWVSSADSNIYIINQRTKSTNQTLSEHQDMVMDFTAGDNDSLYSCSIDGQILRWSTKSIHVTGEIRLPGNTTLRSIHYHNQHLWCATLDELLLLSTNGNVLKKVAMETPGTPGVGSHLECFLLTPQNELWVGWGHTGQIAVYYADSLEKKELIQVTGHGVTTMILVGDKIWVGSREGRLCIYNSFSDQLEQTLYAHGDTVSALCTANDRYVISGSDTLDGKISIWKITSGLLV